MSLANWFDKTQLTTKQLAVLYWACQQQAFVHQLSDSNTDVLVNVELQSIFQMEWPPKHSLLRAFW